MYVDGAWKTADDVLFRRNDEVEWTRIPEWKQKGGNSSLEGIAAAVPAAASAA